MGIEPCIYIFHFQINFIIPRSCYFHRENQKRQFFKHLSKKSNDLMEL